MLAYGSLAPSSSIPSLSSAAKTQIGNIQATATPDPPFHSSASAHLTLLITIMMMNVVCSYGLQPATKKLRKGTCNSTTRDTDPVSPTTRRCCDCHDRLWRSFETKWVHVMSEKSTVKALPKTSHALREGATERTSLRIQSPWHPCQQALLTMSNGRRHLGRKRFTTKTCVGHCKHCHMGESQRSRPSLFYRSR